MIRTVSDSDIILPDIELFIKAVFDGIVVADELSCNYKLELTRNDVTVIADLYRKTTSIEIS